MSTSTEPIKIAICDDSHADQNSILTMLKAVLQSSRIPYTAETFSSADALLCALDGSRTYQLFLLDVVMSGMNGIQLAHRLRDMQQQAEVRRFGPRSTAWSAVRRSCWPRKAACAGYG